MKIGKYLLLSTTILGLVNPLAALADEQTNNNSTQSTEDVKRYRETKVEDQKLRSVNDNNKKTADESEHIKFGDKNLEKAVVKGLGLSETQDYVTLDDIKNFTGNNVGINNAVSNDTEISSLEGLEELTNLPDNVTVSLSLKLTPNVPLKPISNLTVEYTLAIDKDGVWTDEDIKALNSIKVKDGGLFSGLEIDGGRDTTQNRNGLTNEQLKELDPLFSEAINKGTTLVNLSAQNLSDFSYFDKFNNVQLSALNEYNVFRNANIIIKDNTKSISFDSQVKGIDGNKITDDTMTWNTADKTPGYSYGPITGKDGIYTINNYENYTGASNYIVTHANTFDENGNYVRHAYSNGNTLAYSGYSYYKKINEDELKTVNVNYVDEDGNIIDKSEVLSGVSGDTYKADEKTISGYIFKEAKDNNESGKFTDKTQTVTMVYKKLNTPTPVKPVADGKLTVKYVDENGKEISKPVVTTKKVGTEYKTEKKDIQGYVFEKVEGKETGKYTADGQTVTYVYKALGNKTPVKPVADGKLTVKYVDESGKEISEPVVTTKKAGTEYKTEKKDIQGYVFDKVEGKETGKYTADGQTITYVYKALNTKTPVKPVAEGKLTVKYVDESGKEISKPVVTTEKAGTEYKTEKKDIQGYIFKEVKGKETGKYTADGQTVTYVYKTIGTNTPTKPVVPTDPSKPVSPTNPDTPNNSDNDNKSSVNGNNSGTNDSNSNTNGNNSPINNAVNNVVNGAQTLLPNTSAEKVTFAGIVSAVLVSLAGLVIWKKRK